MCADQAFSFDGWPPQRKVYWEKFCSSEWLCVSGLCVLHVLCMLGWQRFVVESVNGVILLLVPMVGAPTIEMCAMQVRDTSGFAGGAHWFSHYDRVFFFFHVGVCRREQDFKQHNVSMKARWSDDCDAWWPCTSMSV